jgi:hypothetical protein
MSAPAGSGKTVLLRSWISQAGVAGSAAWVPAWSVTHGRQEYKVRRLEPCEQRWRNNWTGSAA